MPFTVRNFCGVYSHASDSLHGPSVSGAVRVVRNTHLPVDGWKITLDGRLAVRSVPVVVTGQDYFLGIKL